MSVETAFEGVLRQIDDTVPFEPGYYNESYLDRRITARMRRRDTESHAEYERLLREDDDERQALMDALTINVTEFFRTFEMWDVLRDVLLFDTLEASLADDGMLVLGMTESVPPDRSDRYEPIDKRRRVFGRV